MPKVVIFEKATQKVVATHPVSFGLMGGQATEADLFDLAWNAAVEDKAVSPIGRDQYDFRIENQAKISSPCFSTMESNFSAVPLGRLAPASHF